MFRTNPEVTVGVSKRACVVWCVVVAGCASTPAAGPSVAPEVTADATGEPKAQASSTRKDDAPTGGDVADGGGAEDSAIPEADGAEGQGGERVDVKDDSVDETLGSDLLGSGPLKNIFGDDATQGEQASEEGGELKVGRGAGEETVRIGGLGKVDTGGETTPPKKSEPAIKPSLTLTLSEDVSCDVANAKRVLNAKSRAIRYCYEKTLQSNPTLSGEVVVEWEVGPEGGVSSVKTASTTLKNAKVEGCVNRVIKRMRYQKPESTCGVKATFAFAPRK